MAIPENFDLAHVGAVELFTPKFEESLHFFRDLLAMKEVARIGDTRRAKHHGEQNAASSAESRRKRG